MASKILVVDDDEAILESIKIVLTEEGYDVVTAEKVASLQDILEINPDLIILDVFLLGQDGRQIARDLKADQHTKHIPIIRISALPSAEKSAEASGANIFLPKPFDMYNLLELIKKQLGGKE